MKSKGYKYEISVTAILFDWSFIIGIVEVALVRMDFTFWISVLI